MYLLALFVRTIPYTQNLDLGVARAQYPVPGQTPKYNGSTGWSNRGIEGPLENFNDYRNAMAMRNMIQLLSNTTMDAPFFIAQGMLSLSLSLSLSCWHCLRCVCFALNSIT